MKPEKQTKFIYIVEREIARMAYCTPQDIEMVSYVWTLGNLKAVFAVLNIDSNDYFEATYNVNKDEIYLVQYDETMKVVL